jgi:hypothetical protein
MRERRTLWRSWWTPESRGGTHKKKLVNRFPPFFFATTKFVVLPSHSFFSLLARFPPVSKERQIPGGAPICQKCKSTSPPRSSPMVQEYTMYSYSRTDFGDAAAWGQKVPMRLHRPIFAPSFFTPQTRASAQARCW